MWVRGQWPLPQNGSKTVKFLFSTCSLKFKSWNGYRNFLYWFVIPLQCKREPMKWIFRFPVWPPQRALKRMLGSFKVNSLWYYPWNLSTCIKWQVNHHSSLRAIHSSPYFFIQVKFTHNIPSIVILFDMFLNRLQTSQPLFVDKIFRL